MAKNPKRVIGEFFAVGKHGVTKSFKFHKKFVTVEYVDNGRRVKRRILDLSGKRVRNLSTLGQASGMNLGHCFYLADKYCKDFIKRVRGYKLSSPVTELYVVTSMTVAFYGLKDRT